MTAGVAITVGCGFTAATKANSAEGFEGLQHECSI